MGAQCNVKVEQLEPAHSGEAWRDYLAGGEPLCRIQRCALK